jgi:hypothetical protein
MKKVMVLCCACTLAAACSASAAMKKHRVRGCMMNSSYPTFEAGFMAQMSVCSSKKY